jgi:hypothetical protein
LDGKVTTEDKDHIWSPVGELSVYGSIPVHENFKLFASYNLLWAWRVTRPQRNIFYNDNGPIPTPPGVVVDTENTESFIDGFTVGGEILLP